MDVLGAGLSARGMQGRLLGVLQGFANERAELAQRQPCPTQKQFPQGAHGLVLRQDVGQHGRGRGARSGGGARHRGQQGVQGLQQRLPVLLGRRGARPWPHAATVIAGMLLLRLAWRANSRSAAVAWSRSQASTLGVISLCHSGGTMATAMVVR